MEELPRVALRFTLTQRKPWDFTHSEIVTWRGFGAGHEVINILKKVIGCSSVTIFWNVHQCRISCSTSHEVMAWFDISNSQQQKEDRGRFAFIPSFQFQNCPSVQSNWVPQFLLSYPRSDLKVAGKRQATFINIRLYRLVGWLHPLNTFTVFIYL